MFQEYEFIETPTPELIKALISKQVDPNVYADWMLLFDDYNKANPTKRKGMGCFPCYGVVYSWYKSRERSRLNEDQP